MRAVTAYCVEFSAELLECSPVEAPRVFGPLRGVPPGP